MRKFFLITELLLYSFLASTAVVELTQEFKTKDNTQDIVTEVNDTEIVTSDDEEDISDEE